MPLSTDSELRLKMLGISIGKWCTKDQRYENCKVYGKAFESLAVMLGVEDFSFRELKR